MPDLGVAVLYDQISGELGNKREPVITLRLGKEPIQRGEAPSARRRECLIFAEFANRAAFTAGHSNPGASAERLFCPVRRRQQSPVIVTLQPARSWPRRPEIEVWYRFLASRTLGRFPGEVGRGTSANGKQKDCLARSDRIDAALRRCH